MIYGKIKNAHKGKILSNSLNRLFHAHETYLIAEFSCDLVCFVWLHIDTLDISIVYGMNCFSSSIFYEYEVNVAVKL
jgi:hypothetical protein